MACVTKKRGKWAVDFYDQFGKRRLKVLPKGATKARAKELLREIEDQVAKGVFMPAKQIPMFHVVAGDWVEYKKPKVRVTTWEVYEGHARNHFHDLDGLKISRITIATVERFITDRQKQGMNISTLRKILVTLGQILSYAVRHNYIDHNPLRDAERPRADGSEDQERNKIRILTPGQINPFLSNVESRKYRTLFMLAIFSGSRQGELLGLKWSDIDWENCQIHIQRTFNSRRFFGTKTKTSNRRIDLGPQTITELKKWKLACPGNGLNLVFPNEAGEAIDHNNLLKRHFYPGLEAAGLPKIRFHDLRHTYASLLIEQGENIKYIQSQLGHSNPTVTLNVYAHLMKPVNQEAACRLERAVFGNGSEIVADSKKGLAGNV